MTLLCIIELLPIMALAAWWRRRQARKTGGNTT